MKNFGNSPRAAVSGFRGLSRALCDVIRDGDVHGLESLGIDVYAVLGNRLERDVFALGLALEHFSGHGSGLDAELVVIYARGGDAAALDLLDLGADEVIPEEFETSVRIFSCILAKYGLPKDDIRALTGLVRKNGYRIFRKGDAASAGEAADPEKLFGDLRISQVTVPEGSPAAGRTLRELDTWNRHSVAILAVRRGKETLTAPSPDLVVSPGDVLLLYGSKTGFEAVTGSTVGRGSPSPSPV